MGSIRWRTTLDFVVFFLNKLSHKVKRVFVLVLFNFSISCLFILDCQSVVVWRLRMVIVLKFAHKAFSNWIDIFFDKWNWIDRSERPTCYPWERWRALSKTGEANTFPGGGGKRGARVDCGSPVYILNKALICTISSVYFLWLSRTIQVRPGVHERPWCSPNGWNV